MLGRIVHRGVDVHGVGGCMHGKFDLLHRAFVPVGALRGGDVYRSGWRVHGEFGLLHGAHVSVGHVHECGVYDSRQCVHDGGGLLYGTVVSGFPRGDVVLLRGEGNVHEQRGVLRADAVHGGDVCVPGQPGIVFDDGRLLRGVCVYVGHVPTEHDGGRGCSRLRGARCRVG